MSEHEQAEVSTKLTLDDQAHEALHKLKENFEGLREKVHEVGHEMMGMAKQAAAVAIGFQLSGAVETVKEFGEEVFHSAAHLAEQKKELAGAISMVEKGESSFDELSEKAEKLNEHFEQLGITTGNTKESMLDAFEMIASRSTRSSEEVSGMVDKMAVASKNLPGGLEAMSAAWRDLEMGIVRPKNALVQLMRQTGVVEGGAKKVAKALNAMMQGGKQEDVFKLAETAVDRMAKRMKDAPLSFDQLLTSLRGTREAFFETMGAPMIAAVGPQLEHLKVYLAEHREEIERLAHTMGDKVGEWVKIAGAEIKEAFEYLETHADEISKALEDGAGAIKGAVSFLAEHRDLLLGLAAAQYVGKPALGMLPRGGGARRGLGAAAGKARGAGGLGGTGGAGAALGAGALVAAVGSWTLASDQMGKLEQESGMSFGRLIEHMNPFTESVDAAADRLANINAVVRKIGEDAQKVEATDQDMQHYIESLERSGAAAVEAGDMTEDAYRKVLAQANAQAEGHAKLANAMGGFEAASANVMGAQGIAVGLGMGKITSAFKTATEVNAKEADASARRILSANNALRIALAGATGSVEDALKKLHGLASGGAEGPETKLPPINFGPTTMHIHQDFRNADPDKIALIFRKDIARSATNRITSRFSQTFGF